DQVPREFFSVIGSTGKSEFPLHFIVAVVVINLIGVMVLPHMIATGGGSAKNETSARVGLVAGAGGVHRLPRHIPLKIAMGMMLTARRIPIKEAYRLGLVNEVVPLADLMPTAEKWAADILEVAPLSARASKQMATSGLDWPLEIAMSRTYTEYQAAAASEDFVEGPRAFAEKRKPNWKGA
ncbi:MAG: hypothetical protein IIC83_11850, partial [Chloroflexi bacterium]|nr:hypothetical protein [Chloroflexota bacterium]